MPPDSGRLAHYTRNTLLAGLLASGLLLVVGSVLVLAKHESRASRIPEAGFKLLQHAAHGEGLAILNLGLLLLIFTPVLRVSVLLVGWAGERDGVFTAVAFAVLVLLGISLILGIR